MFQARSKPTLPMVCCSCMLPNLRSVLVTPSGSFSLLMARFFRSLNLRRAKYRFLFFSFSSSTLRVDGLPICVTDHPVHGVATLLPLPALLVTKKLIMPLPGTLALAAPSLPTATVVSAISCVLSVYQALTLVLARALPATLILSVWTPLPVLII